jgi:vesicle coat complex subunit
MQKDTKSEALRKLIMLLKHSSHKVVSDAVIELKSILTTNSASYRAIVVFCVKIIKKLTNEDARSSVIWLVSKYSSSFPTISKELVRKLSANFLEEGLSTKHLLLILGFEVWLDEAIRDKIDPHFAKILEVLLKICSFDKEPTLRQQSAFYKAIFNQSPINKSLCESILQNTKGFESTKDHIERCYLLHSYSFIVNK